MKKNKLPATIKNELEINGVLVNVGDLVIYNYDNSVSKVVRLESEDGYDRIIVIGGKHEGEHHISANDFDSYYKIAKGVDLSEAKEVAEKILSGELPASSLFSKEENEEAGNKLMVVNANMYLLKKEEVEKASMRVEVIKGLIKAKTDAIERSVRGALEAFGKVITKLNKIIFTLSLYAGIEESIKQIQSGAPANEDEPIHLMQLMKFMDEEVGDPSNGGISYDSIDKFDSWLLSFNKHLGYFNYELLIPFKKGVRIMRVRRHPSERYKYDAFNNAWEIGKEMETYVIIRNGENFYTVSSKMEFAEKLFPDQYELQEFYEKGGDFDEDESMQKYKHGMVLMQGLVDRTDVFGNVFGKVSFLKSESVEEGRVVFFYENEGMLITDGSLSSLDFLNTSTIEEGDRVLVYGAYTDEGRRLYKKYFPSKYHIPSSPEDGIYKLEYDNEYKTLYFRYRPSDEIWTAKDGYHERKIGFSFKVRPTDSFIVNIDMVSHRNISWMDNVMYDRRDRKQYLRAVGLFNAIIKFKRIELNEEKPFSDMVMSVCKVQEEDALDAIHWWKTKNKHKRSLFVDDVKALRMISKKIKSDKLKNKQS